MDVFLITVRFIFSMICVLYVLCVPYEFLIFYHLDKTAEEMKKSIKTKQEYLGVEKKKEKVANPLDRPLAIEGSKGPLAITGGETGEKEKQPGAVPNPVAKPNEHGALVPVTTEDSFQPHQASGNPFRTQTVHILGRPLDH